jgi:signal transduction histidine kinase
VREDFLLQLLGDYVLLNEILTGPYSQQCLQKVGIKQGKQVEDRFRKLHGCRDKLTGNQFADLCVTFLNGLGGAYQAGKQDDRKLVLTSTRCPFGYLSIKIPVLCNVLMSVLGDIAVRNFPYCKVSQEHSMAKGASDCQLVFYLQETEEAKKAEGILFFDDPIAYLLTPTEVKSIFEMRNVECPSLPDEDQMLMTQESQLCYEIFTDVQLGILTMDVLGKNTYMNKTAQELLFLGGEQDTEIAITIQSLMNETMALQKKFDQHEVHVPTPEGSRFYSINTAPIFYDDGKPNGAVSIFQDVTKQKILENELVQMEKFSLLAELAAGTAHEIRNPMTTMRGFLQLLAKEFQPEAKGYEYCYLMIDEIDRANAIITEFLLLTKPAAPRLREANLHNILEEIFLLIESKSLLENVELCRCYAKSLPLVSVDSAQVKQVFLNLATNAIQAMPSGGQLTISTSTKSGKAVVRFSDTGCGISEPQLLKIFDPFYTTKEQGTGLGLTISYRIIEHHNGRLSVESVLGKGTTFIVEFPSIEDD